MTPADTPEAEIARLTAGNVELAEANVWLTGEVMELRGQLAEMRCLTPYDLPADVLAVLTILLPGWPSRRWAELAVLIEHREAAP